MSLTAERLRELLQYHPESGFFFWRVDRGAKEKAGDVAGDLQDTGCWRICVDYTRYKAHRLVWLYVTGEWPEAFIDHINGNKLDNRFENLRDVSKAVNTQNQRRARADNKSCGLLGVSRNRKRWMANITVDRKPHYLGTFDTPEEAHAAYVAAKRVLHPGCTI